MRKTKTINEVKKEQESSEGIKDQKKERKKEERNKKKRPLRLHAYYCVCAVVVITARRETVGLGKVPLSQQSGQKGQSTEERQRREQNGRQNGLAFCTEYFDKLKTILRKLHAFYFFYSIVPNNVGMNK